MAKFSLKQDELDALAQAIARAEERTSGEIRLVIVRRSTPALHVRITLWLATLSLCFFLLWEFGGGVGHKALWLPPAIIVVTRLLAEVLARSAAVQRLFLSAAEMEQAVWTRAELEFHREGLSGTRRATGILLFLSVYEHQAVVLADKAISGRLPQSTWDEVVQTMIAGGKERRWREKLEEAIGRCGELLAEHFPLQPGDVNELQNHVVVKD